MKAVLICILLCWGSDVALGGRVTAHVAAAAIDSYRIGSQGLGAMLAGG